MDPVRRVFQYLLVEGKLVEWNDLSGTWKRTPPYQDCRFSTK